MFRMEASICVAQYALQKQPKEGGTADKKEALSRKERAARAPQLLPERMGGLRMREGSFLQALLRSLLLLREASGCLLGLCTRWFFAVPSSICGKSQ